MQLRNAARRILGTGSGRPWTPCHGATTTGATAGSAKLRYHSGPTCCTSSVEHPAPLRPSCRCSTSIATSSTLAHLQCVCPGHLPATTSGTWTTFYVPAWSAMYLFGWTTLPTILHSTPQCAGSLVVVIRLGSCHTVRRDRPVPLRAIAPLTCHVADRSLRQSQHRPHASAGPRS